MSNLERITIEAQKAGIFYNGTNLKTYREWEKVGRVPKYGQKAILKVKNTWRHDTYTDKETNEKYNKYNKNPDMCLFAEWQTTEIKEKVKQ